MQQTSEILTFAPWKMDGRSCGDTLKQTVIQLLKVPDEITGF